LLTIGANDLAEQVAVLEQSLLQSSSRASHLYQAQALQKAFLKMVSSISAVQND
jgi:hypothetical protein